MINHNKLKISAVDTLSIEIILSLSCCIFQATTQSLSSLTGKPPHQTSLIASQRFSKKKQKKKQKKHQQFFFFFTISSSEIQQRKCLPFRFSASVFLLSHLRTTPPHTWPEMDEDTNERSIALCRPNNTQLHRYPWVEKLCPGKVCFLLSFERIDLHLNGKRDKAVKAVYSPDHSIDQHFCCTQIFGFQLRFRRLRIYRE